jgi:hypothetical protein
VELATSSKLMRLASREARIRAPITARASKGSGTGPLPPRSCRGETFRCGFLEIGLETDFSRVDMTGASLANYIVGIHFPAVTSRDDEMGVPLGPMPSTAILGPGPLRLPVPTCPCKWSSPGCTVVPSRTPVASVIAGLLREIKEALLALLSIPTGSDVAHSLAQTSPHTLVTFWILARGMGSMDERADFGGAEQRLSRELIPSKHLDRIAAKNAVDLWRALPPEEAFHDLLHYIIDLHSPRTRPGISESPCTGDRVQSWQ